MDRERAAQILQSTSQNMQNVQDSLVKLSLRKEEAQDKKTLVNMNKIDRLFTMLDRADPSAHGPILDRAAELLNQEFKVKLNPQTFRKLGPDINRESQKFLMAPEGSEDEKTALGDYTNFMSASTDVNNQHTVTGAVNALKGLKIVLKRNGWPVGGLEAAKAEKELGMVPVKTPGMPTGMEPRPISDESSSVVMGRYHTQLDDRLKELAAAKKKGGEPLSWEDVEKTIASVKALFVMSNPDMAPMFGYSTQPPTAGGGGVPSEEGVPPAEGASPPLTAPQPTAQPVTAGRRGKAPTGAGRLMPLGYDSGLYAPKPDQLDVTMKKAIIDSRTFINMTQDYMKDFAWAQKRYPDWTGPGGKGWLTEGMNRTDALGVVAQWAQYIRLGTTEVPPVLTKLNTMTNIMGKIQARAAEGRGGMTDLDFMVGQYTIPRISQSFKSGAGNMLASLQMTRASLQSYLDWSKDHGTSPGDMKFIGDTVKKVNEFETNMRTLVLASDMPVKLTADVVSKIVDGGDIPDPVNPQQTYHVQGLMDQLFTLKEQGKIGSGPLNMEQVKELLTPGTAVVLDGLEQIKDKNGRTPLLDQVNMLMIQRFKEMKASESAPVEGGE